MIHCTSCPMYNDGEGTKKCLTCTVQKKAAPERYWQVGSGLPSHMTVEDLASPAIEMTMLETLKRLPLNQSLPIVAFYWMKAQQREIAEAFGESGSTIASRIRLGRDRIKRIIKKEGRLAPRMRNKKS